MLYEAVTPKPPTLCGESVYLPGPPFFIRRLGDYARGPPRPWFQKSCRHPGLKVFPSTCYTAFNLTSYWSAPNITSLKLPTSFADLPHPDWHASPRAGEWTSQETVTWPPREDFCYLTRPLIQFQGSQGHHSPMNLRAPCCLVLVLLGLRELWLWTCYFFFRNCFLLFKSK